jgi:acyl-CoA thioesterase I
MMDKLPQRVPNVEKRPLRIRRAARSLAFAAAVIPLSLTVPAYARPACDAPLRLLRFTNPLARVAKKLAEHEPVVIVAIGSSSTQGVGASSKAANYPSQLEAELKRRFPTHPIKVINRGIGGEVIADMLKRFDRAVIAAKPDLVLWQLGTNAVLRNRPVGDRSAAIRSGLAKIRATGADIVLIDPQFAPKVISKHDIEPMLHLISSIAKEENVGLFRRFAVMKRWHDEDHLQFTTFVSPDGLHMNDWSYACMAKGLAAAIADAATRPMMSAAVSRDDVTEE